jgi:hypothetical protein
MPLIDVRLRYLAIGLTWPVYWRDVKSIVGRVTGQRYRVDVLGPAGIGKTTFIGALAQSLGERVPHLGKHHPVSPEWAEAFNHLYSTHFLLMEKDWLGWEDRHSKTLHLSQIVDLEKLILQSSRQQIVINGVGVIRHRLGHFSKLSKERPDFVAHLLSDRVFINCASRDPVSRAVGGKRARGDRDAFDDRVTKAVTRKVEKISRGVDAIKDLGVPVLDLDMDRPRKQNIALVADFLRQHGMTSTAIEAQARKASPSTPADG